MSSSPAVRVSNLSKCYPIYEKPVNRLKQFVLPRVDRWAGRQPRVCYREFWALRDVDLEIARGEVVGIIGRNGSGKSTLLQVICGTLSPTSGSVQVSGRIAALLELGSGFNPEFTGRENVYLNATVLGLSRREIDARFDDICRFAAIGDFIDRPVKTYSSGMFVRLAFAVAVHADPEILVVDEALSVGDIAFQNKCIEAIKRMVARGVTILFVTHDLGTLQLICDRAVWLEDGRVRAVGDAVAIAQEYYVAMLGPGEHSRTPVPAQQNTGKAEFTEIRIRDGLGDQFSLGDSLSIAFRLRARECLEAISFCISVYRSDGDWLVGQTSRDAGVLWPALDVGAEHSGTIDLAPLSLAPGDYFVALGATSSDYSVCYALSGLGLKFSVRSPFPTWGKFHHPCRWQVVPA